MKEEFLIIILVISAGRQGRTLQCRIFFSIPNYTSFRTLLSKCKVTWFVRVYLEVPCCDVHANQLTCKAPFRLCLCIFFSQISQILFCLSWTRVQTDANFEDVRVSVGFGTILFYLFSPKDGDLYQKHFKIRFHTHVNAFR